MVDNVLSMGQSLLLLTFSVLDFPISPFECIIEQHYPVDLAVRPVRFHFCIYFEPRTR